MPSRLVITVHGVSVPGYFTVPDDTTLMFYVQHKRALNDPGLKRFVKGVPIVVETLSPGAKCHNYLLSKYTNTDEQSRRHNKANETYGLIENLPDHWEDWGDDICNLLEVTAKKDELPTGQFADLEAHCTAMLNRENVAILTVRSRLKVVPVSLSSALDALKEAGHVFSQIDCSFCRYVPFGGSEDVQFQFG